MKGMAPQRYIHTVKENRSLWYRWHGIKKRCLNKNDARYPEYGGRGIKMCEEWQASFDNFAEWALSNGYREDLTIERLDVNGDYCPENCIWIPRREQALNKRDTIWVDYKGEHTQLRKLCDRLGKNYDTVHNRYTALGWDIEKAIEEPSEQENSFSSRCRKHNMPENVVRDRIRRLGWTEEEALSVPATGGTRNLLSKLRGVTKACAVCGTEYYPASTRNNYCCDECRNKAKSERRNARRTA